jgi:hypothetical protein
LLRCKDRAVSIGGFSVSIIVFFSFLSAAAFFLLKSSNEAQERLVINSYLDLESAIIERTVASSELWFRSRMNEASVREIEDEVFRYFVNPIRILRSGDAWIYNRDYVIYDLSSDFPMEYRGKRIDEIFSIQAKLGASHYDAVVRGVLEAGEGRDWYLWLPSKGREWASGSPSRWGKARGPSASRPRRRRSSSTTG